jgi:hypothetical protein
MRHLSAVLAFLVGATLTLVALPAAADDPERPPPTLKQEAAWVVAKGAAVQVRYTVTCPDFTGRMRVDTDVRRGGASLGTGFLEFDCGGGLGQERTITDLVSITGVEPGRRVKVRSVLLNCLYFDSTGVPGCYEVTKQRRFRVQAARFVPESTDDVNFDIAVPSTTLRRDGRVRVAVLVGCLDDTFGLLDLKVTQYRNGVGRSATLPPPVDLICDAGQERTLRYTLAAPRRFVEGSAVVEAAIAACGENCDRAFDTRVVRLAR